MLWGGHPEGRRTLDAFSLLLRTGLVLGLAVGIRRYHWQCYGVTAALGLYEAVAVLLDLFITTTPTAVERLPELVALATACGMVFLAFALKHESFPHLGIYGVKTVAGQFALGPSRSLRNVKQAVVNHE